MHQYTPLAENVQMQGGGSLPVWQSPQPLQVTIHRLQRDFAYIAPRGQHSKVSRHFEALVTTTTNMDVYALKQRC